MSRKRTPREVYEDFDKLPDAADVDVRVISLIEDKCPSTVWRWVKEGKYPQPHRKGDRTTCWRVGTVRKHRAAA